MTSVSERPWLWCFSLFTHFGGFNSPRDCQPFGVQRLSVVEELATDEYYTDRIVPYKSYLEGTLFVDSLDENSSITAVMSENPCPPVKHPV